MLELPILDVASGLIFCHLVVTAARLEVWPGDPLQPTGLTQWATALHNHFLGWLMTALAISLGAPLLFDMLNTIVTIRSAGMATEEEQKDPRKAPQPHEPGLTVQGGLYA